MLIADEIPRPSAGKRPLAAAAPQPRHTLLCRASPLYIPRPAFETLPCYASAVRVRPMLRRPFLVASLLSHVTSAVLPPRLAVHQAPYLYDFV